MNDYVFMTDKEFQEYRNGGKTKSRVNEAGNYTKPSMRKRLFQRIKAGSKGGNPGQWSARKAQMLAKQYKAKGGGYKNQDGGYANTPFERKYGILAGKNKFKFPVRAQQQMTMTPGGLPIDFPIYYQGLVNGVKSDEGVAMPGQDFSVYGDEVREYPMYQMGDYVSTNNTSSSTGVKRSDISEIPSFYDPNLDYSSMRKVEPLNTLPTRSGTKTDNTLPIGIQQVDTSRLPGLQAEREREKEMLFDPSRLVNPDDYKLRSYDIPYTSVAYNMSRFLEGPDKVPVITNPYESKVLSGLRANRMRTDYRPHMTALNKVRSDIRSSSGSIPQMMANLQSSTSAIGNKMSEENMRMANANAQMRAKYYDTMRAMGADRASRMRSVDDINRRNREAQMNYLAQTAADIDGLRKQKRTLANAQLQDRMKMLGINMQAGDVKYGVDTEGNRVMYFRDPISGEFKKSSV